MHTYGLKASAPYYFGKIGVKVEIGLVARRRYDKLGEIPAGLRPDG
jgi:hypothetical protein